MYDAEQVVTIFAIVLAQIFPRHAESVIESQSRSLETHAMLGEVPRRLPVIPLEFIIAHDTTA